MFLFSGPTSNVVQIDEFEEDIFPEVAISSSSQRSDLANGGSTIPCRDQDIDDLLLELDDNGDM